MAKTYLLSVLEGNVFLSVGKAFFLLEKNVKSNMFHRRIVSEGLANLLACM